MFYCSFFQGFKVGYIVFRKPASVETVKQLPFDTPLVISTPKNPVSTGVKSKSSQ